MKPPLAFKKTFPYSSASHLPLQTYHNFKWRCPCTSIPRPKTNMAILGTSPFRKNGDTGSSNSIFGDLPFKSYQVFFGGVQTKFHWDPLHQHYVSTLMKTLATGLGPDGRCNCHPAWWSCNPPSRSWTDENGTRMKIRHDANRPKKNGKMAALHRQKWEKHENSIQHIQNLEILQLNEMYIGMDSYLYQMESETTLTPRAQLMTQTSPSWNKETAFWWT